MAWKIELDSRARREINRLDRQAARRILIFLRKRVAQMNDPRVIGTALRKTGAGSVWRYRVGDYRVVVAIEDQAARILVLRIGHRRDIYRH